MAYGPWRPPGSGDGNDGPGCGQGDDGCVPMPRGAPCPDAPPASPARSADPKAPGGAVDSKAVDSKNRFTSGHSERVATYAVALAKSLELTEEKVSAIRQAALLHDVGKIGIAESILIKEQPLNLEEMDELKRHSELGRAMLAGAGMPEIGRWVHHLHERFDGQGYPTGLAGREIPMESRILHAADALDLMTRPREYRRHRPLKEAVAELSFNAGTRLDPELAGRLVDLVESGEITVPGHEIRPHGGRRATERSRSRPAC